MKESPNNTVAIQSINRAIKNTKIGIRKGFFLVGQALVKEASTDILKKDKTGKEYSIRRGRRITKHIASAPGESFANLSGAARRTLGFNVNGTKGLEFGFRANTDTFYTRLLEGKLNRPALKNSIDKNESNTVKILERELKKALD